MKIIISLFFMGVSFGFGPCLASCGPLLISYTAGTKKNFWQSIGTYLLFSSGRVAVYVILGLLVFLLGQFIAQTWLASLPLYRYIFIIAGAFIIFLGIFTAFGRHLEFKYCQVLEKNLLQQYHKSALILGLITGILPCAPLLALLGYVALVSKTWPQAFIYCLSFGLGTFLSPLLMISILSGLIPRFLEGQKAIYYRVISVVCGLIMVFLGINLILRAGY
jgi:sulfite exporter TauE/SafE